VTDRRSPPVPTPKHSRSHCPSSVTDRQPAEKHWKIAGESQVMPASKRRERKVKGLVELKVDLMVECGKLKWWLMGYGNKKVVQKIGFLGSGEKFKRHGLDLGAILSTCWSTFKNIIHTCACDEPATADLKLQSVVHAQRTQVSAIFMISSRCAALDLRYTCNSQIYSCIS
ncbi:hypothetical protein HAX54_051973, partial [Datura stramonium]|nr:hypothetical protein [Datura stramonium]